MSRTNYILFDAEIKETEKAVLFSICGENVWIPKSVIIHIENNTIEIKSWYLEEYELDKYII